MIICLNKFNFYYLIIKLIKKHNEIIMKLDKID